MFVPAFDTAVNMGPNRAIKVLQQAVGSDADGAFGDKTKAACDSCDLGEAMINYCEIREGIYRNLAKRPGQDRFLKGWLNRLNALRHEMGLPGFEGATAVTSDPRRYIGRATSEPGFGFYSARDSQVAASALACRP